LGPPRDVFAGTCYSNLVQDNPYDDDFLVFTDEHKLLDKKLIIYDAKTKFNIWFKSAYGQVIDLDPTKTRIIVELILEF
jgi:hypothetical protein